MKEVRINRIILNNNKWNAIIRHTHTHTHTQHTYVYFNIRLSYYNFNYCPF